MPINKADAAEAPGGMSRGVDGKGDFCEVGRDFVDDCGKSLRQKVPPLEKENREYLLF